MRPIEAAAVAYSQRQAFPNKVIKSRRIKNSELIADVNGSVLFSSDQKYSINPGLESSFPWLAVVSGQWQQYHFHSLRYRYVTRSSTSGVGSIILSPDYNPKETPPVTEQQATNTQDAVEDVVWKELVCPLDPSAMFPLGPRKQIRRTLVAGDLSVYDAGRLFVCTVGQTDSSTIGKLWVDYDVELYVPQNSPSSDTSPTISSMFTIDAAQTVVNATPTTVDISETIYDAIGIGEPASGVFIPPAGVYNIYGFITVRDSANEAFEAFVELFKNGATIRTQSLAATARSPAATTEIITLPFNDIIPCNGTDTVTLTVFLQGAAGTLTVDLEGVSMMWRLA